MLGNDMLHGKVIQNVAERFYRRQTDFDQTILIHLFYVSEEVFQTPIEVREQVTHIGPQGKKSYPFHQQKKRLSYKTLKHRVLQRNLNG